jgi:hypothetical protein
MFECFIATDLWDSQPCTWKNVRNILPCTQHIWNTDCQAPAQMSPMKHPAMHLNRYGTQPAMHLDRCMKHLLCILKNMGLNVPCTWTDVWNILPCILIDMGLVCHAPEEMCKTSCHSSQKINPQPAEPKHMYVVFYHALLHIWKILLSTSTEVWSAPSQTNETACHTPA